MTQVPPPAPGYPPGGPPYGYPAPWIAPPVPDRWARLHPLSPVVQVGRGVAGLAVIWVFGLGDHRSRSGEILPWIVGGIIVLTLALSTISWLVTRWRIHGGDLQIETGVLRRQSLRIPLARVQAVDVVVPLVARLLGLAEVRVVSAGRGMERGRLAYLPAAQAGVLRAQLLALAHGLVAETPEAPAVPVLNVDNARLVLAMLLRGRTLFVLGLFGWPLILGLLLPGAPTGPYGLFSGLFAVGLDLFQSINADGNFAVFHSPDGLRLNRGLLQLRHETIPFGRIQAVRWVEPLLWRPFGWCRLEVDVARQKIGRQTDREAAQVGRTLLPVATRAEAAWLLAHVMPGATPVPPAHARPPRRAWWKAPLSRTYLAFSHDAHYVVARTGRVRPATVIMPLEKIQSVRLAQGPLLRALRLADVFVDTAGSRWAAAGRCRDTAEAESLVFVLTDLARAARRAAA